MSRWRHACPQPVDIHLHTRLVSWCRSHQFMWKSMRNSWRYNFWCHQQYLNVVLCAELLTVIVTGNVCLQVSGRFCPTTLHHTVGWCPATHDCKRSLHIIRVEMAFPHCFLHKTLIFILEPGLAVGFDKSCCTACNENQTAWSIFLFYFPFIL